MNARHKARMQRNEKTDEQALAEDRARAQRKEQEKERRKVVRALEKEVAERASRQSFIDALEAAPDPRPFKLRAPRKKGRLPDAAYVMLASDWHLGERVRPETVGWRNEYDPDIAQARAHQYWESQLIMLAAARAAWQIRRGVLWLGGDLMTGWIHEEYLEENFLSPTEEALLAYSVLRRGIDRLLAASDFEHLQVVTSNGNHGRTGQRIKVSSYARNSYEWMLYQFLAMAYEDEPRITFQVGTGYVNMVDLYGFRIGFHHGDAIGYQGGVGGLTIPANRRFSRQAQAIPVHWEGTEKGAPHLQVFGHFHQRLYPGSFITNASLIGYSAYAERIGAPHEEPTQTSFVVDSKYRAVSNYNPIFVTKPRK